MNWVEWYATGIATGFLSLFLTICACSYYMVTHMTKYGPRMMKVMMKRGKSGRK